MIKAIEPRVILSQLPMPPSSNNIYITNRKTGGRFPSDELKEFKQAMKDWRLQNLLTCQQAVLALVARLPSKQKFLRVDRYFSFRRDQLIGKNGQPKSNDASNRIKCLDDALATEILGLDDCWFASGGCEKLFSGGLSPFVTVVITQTPLRSWEDWALEG